MKSGIIGFPQVGKTSLFAMLTGAEINLARREDRLGVAVVPDERLDSLARLYSPRKLTHATIELVEVGSLTPESLRDGSGIAALRGVDALVHVLGAFNPGSNPLADLQKLDFDMVVSDLGQVEKRRERLQRDIKRQRTAALVEEDEMLDRMQRHLETEAPLRAMPLTPEEEKRTRGFQFLSQKPVLYVLNVAEDEAAALDAAVDRHGLAPALVAPHTGAMAVCARIEAEIAGLPPADAAAFLAGYGLSQPGVARLAQAIYRLLGLVSFFTAGDDECRAWTIARETRAADAAGVIHTDLSKHFIRAEVIDWEELLTLGSESAAREKGRLRLEGKDYKVRDGDVMNIRHSG